MNSRGTPIYRYLNYTISWEPLVDEYIAVGNGKSVTAVRLQDVVHKINLVDFAQRSAN